MSPFLIAAAFLVVDGVASAQTVGGRWAWDFVVKGDYYHQGLGASVAGVGDQDGDGRDDFAIATSLARWNGPGQVLVHSGFDGSRIRTLDAPDFQVWAYVAVAAAGDVDRDGIGDVVAGAPRSSSSSGNNSGSILVYSGATGALLLRMNGVIYDDMGESVASAGDVDGDGHADLITGGPQAHAIGLGNSGVAHVFSGATGLELFHFDGTQDALLGWAVTGVGDWNLDGRDDFAISAISADVGSLLSAGSIYVHSGADGSLLRRFDGEVAGLQLGRDLDAADVDADGILDLIVGVPNASLPGLPYVGSIRVYSGATGLLMREIFGHHRYERFGWSVAGAGNLDGDGHDDLIVGSPYAHPGHTQEAGVVRLFSGRTGDLLHTERGRKAGENFGMSVASAGDGDGDGFDHVLVGRPDVDANGVSGAGAVYLAGYQTFMTPSADFISVAAGGTILFDVRFPAEAGGAAYQFLLSRTGVGPTWQFDLQVPLTPDALFHRTSLRNYPAGAAGFAGVLSVDGEAGASLLVPPGTLPASLIGSQIWIAAIARDWSGTGRFSSVARSLRFVP